MNNYFTFTGKCVYISDARKFGEKCFIQNIGIREQYGKTLNFKTKVVGTKGYLVQNTRKYIGKTVMATGRMVIDKNSNIVLVINRLTLILID